MFHSCNYFHVLGCHAGYISLLWKNNPPDLIVCLNNKSSQTLTPPPQKEEEKKKSKQNKSLKFAVNVDFEGATRLGSADEKACSVPPTR